MLWASVTARVPAHRSPRRRQGHDHPVVVLALGHAPLELGHAPDAQAVGGGLGTAPQAGDGPLPWRPGGRSPQTQALGVEDARLPLAQGGADGQGRHHVGNLGGVDGDAPQAAKGLTGPGVAGGEDTALQETGKPNWRNSSTQALSPWREAASSPWMATGAPVGDSAAMHRKKAAWDQSPSTWAVVGGIGAGRRGCASPWGVSWAVTPYSLKMERVSAHVALGLQGGGEDNLAVALQQGQGEQQPGDKLGADVAGHAVDAAFQLAGKLQGAGRPGSGTPPRGRAAAPRRRPGGAPQAAAAHEPGGGPPRPRQWG